MPVSKKKDECWGDVMGEFKRGQLHSGKKGPVVKSRDQAKAIAASMCRYGECNCGGSCEKCKKKQAMMAIGYSEKAADTIVEQCFKTKEEGLEDACWPGYEAIGTKPGKGGKPVPNCVKKNKKK